MMWRVAAHPSLRLLPAAPVDALSLSAWDLQGDEGAAKKFQEVSKAYDTLRDPQKRQQYDSMGADGYERMAETGGAGWSPVSCICTVPSCHHFADGRLTLA